MYLTLLFRGGVPLLLIYAGLMLALAGAAWRLARRGPRPLDALLGRVVVALVALLAILHLLEPYFATTGLPHLIWLLAALVISAQHDPEPALPR
jgi:O-antigen ligase